MSADKKTSKRSAVGATTKLDNGEVEMNVVPSIDGNEPEAKKPTTPLAVAIKDLTEGEHPVWMLDARVTQKSPLGVSQAGKKWFRFSLQDSTGTVEVISFDHVAEQLLTKIVIDEVFRVQGLTVRSSTFREITTKELLVRDASSCTMLPHSDSIPAIEFQFQPLDQLSFEDNPVVDVLGMLTKVGDLITATDGKNWKRRDLEIIDQSERTVRVAVWGAIAEFHHFHPFEPIAFIKAKVNVHDGFHSINCDRATVLWDQLELKESDDLIAWFAARTM